MSVKVPFRMGFIICGALVESHCVGKGSTKQVVVSGSHALENIGEPLSIILAKIRQTREMGFADDQGLEGPNCPKRDQGLKGAISANQAFADLQLAHQIVT